MVPDEPVALNLREEGQSARPVAGWPGGPWQTMVEPPGPVLRADSRLIVKILRELGSNNQSQLICRVGRCLEVLLVLPFGEFALIVSRRRWLVCWRKQVLTIPAYAAQSCRHQLEKE